RGLFALLILGVSGVLVLVWKTAPADGELAPWAIALALGATLGGVYAARRLMACPACGAPLGSLVGKVCRNCGAVLTSEPAQTLSRGPMTSQARARLEEGRRLLERWAGVQRGLARSPLYVGAAAAVVLALVLRRGVSRPDWGECAGLGLFL